MSQVSSIYKLGREDPADQEKVFLDVNNRELAQRLAELLEKIRTAKVDRGAANAAIAEAKANLETDGIPREVVATLSKYLQWDADRQLIFRDALAVCMTWVTDSPQRDLFEDVTR